MASLNLESNNLTTIESIVPGSFPALKSFAISKNKFDCEYLVKYLHQWENTTEVLIKNSTPFQTGINGIDCVQKQPVIVNTTV